MFGITMGDRIREGKSVGELMFTLGGGVGSTAFLNRSEYLLGSGAIFELEGRRRGARGGNDMILQVVYVCFQTLPNSNFLKFKDGRHLGLSPYSLMPPGQKKHLSALQWTPLHDEGAPPIPWTGQYRSDSRRP